MVSVLARRNASACALPRPSATASARLANSTVSHSQMTISQANTRRVGDRDHRGEHRADLDDEHDRVLATACAGRACATRPAASCQSILGSSRPPWTRRGGRVGSGGAGCAGGAVDSCGSWSSVQALRERTQRQRREVGEGDDDERDAGEHADEQQPVRRQRALGRRASVCCRASDPARPSTNTIGRNRPSSMTMPSAVLYQIVFDRDPGERAAVVVRGRGEGVQHLGQAVRAGVAACRRARPGRAIAIAVPTSTSAGVVSRYSEANLTSRPPSFLPRYSGVRPDHQTRRRTR